MKKLKNCCRSGGERGTRTATEERIGNLEHNVHKPTHMTDINDGTASNPSLGYYFPKVTTGDVSTIVAADTLVPKATIDEIGGSIVLQLSNYGW